MSAPPELTSAVERSNRRLLLPYALPYVAYVAVASIPTDYLSPEANYGLRIVASGAALGWAWRQTCSLRGPRPWGGSIGVGVLGGLVGTALWIALKAPLVEAGGEAVSETLFLLRIAASVGLVPIFEELLMRGYVLRLALQWEHARSVGADDPWGEAFEHRSLEAVAPGAATPLAILLSTLVFTLGHGSVEWPAALAYGFLMGGLWIARKDLLSCVTAHAVTNLTLALYVRFTGHWALW